MSTRESRIEELDFLSPDVNAIAAARLFYSETEWFDYGDTHDYDHERKLKGVLGLLGRCSNYGLIAEGGVLCAAASVEYGYTTTPDEAARANIFCLAVHPEFPRQTYGSLLIKHVAERAVVHNDSVVEFTPFPGDNEELEFIVAEGFGLAKPRELVFRAEASKILA